MSVRAVDGQRSFYHTDYLCRDLFGSQSLPGKVWPKLLELSPKLEALYCAENGWPGIDPVYFAG